MSLQKGNVQRTRPQKHKNHSAFKNSLHDTSNRTKLINSLQVSDVCVRCKDIIDWKIKYKKYKPLSQPKTCVKCGLKTVKQAYHVMCTDCGKKLETCTKCCQKKEIVPAPPSKDEQIKLDNEMKDLLQSLPERRRRTFLRYMDKLGKQKKQDDEEPKDKDAEKNALMNKLKQLKVSEEDEDFDSDDFGDSYDKESSNSDSEDEKE
ncbi:unnamed protein product [Acanthoscelides obtectus]|uniref:Uncharacterized protein n=1 Tax=Acanthoscelides obtectus TaxID=200917 RepID=A0A9P0NS85_ACAOB|nr:unnamed protein product [Acanthoscelides obtectus]CAK1639643.1 hypothetical protein AOBTE_LOCUS11291 [Acanthoscelides obtectus]